MIKKIICYFLGHKYFKMKVFDVSADEEGHIETKYGFTAMDCKTEIYRREWKRFKKGRKVI